LKGAAMLPVLDPGAAARELYRAVGELGLVATNFIPYFGEMTLEDKSLYPVYHAAQDLDVPIGLHNNSAISPARHLMDNFALRHALNSVCSMVGLGTVVMGGVMDEFPTLKFAVLEAGGGWVPYVMERLERRLHAMPHWSNHLKQTPMEYMRSGRLYYSVEPDELTVPMVAELMGEDWLVIGSDYSHFDGTAPESIRMVTDRTDISEELKKKILSDNPARLYKL
ncbi:amidohydrolase, partial [Dehalococcoidia bacterium]|nr:amidohydrolase [Dehalococcoidia bacterium]